jgi:hypothetical protein
VGVICRARILHHLHWFENRFGILLAIITAGFRKWSGTEQEGATL